MRPFIACFHEYYGHRSRPYFSEEPKKSQRRNTKIRFKKRARARLKAELRKQIDSLQELER